MQSTKPTKSGTVTPAAADPARRWTVQYHREVGKDVTHYGLACPDFNPTLEELVEQLETNPKQYPKKHGKLKEARAASLKYRNVTHRAVFVVIENTRCVRILALEPHDEAYDLAIKRLR